MTHDFFLVHLLRDPVAVAVAVAVAVVAVAAALRVAYVGVILVRGGFLRESEGVGWVRAVRSDSSQKSELS